MSVADIFDSPELRPQPGSTDWMDGLRTAEDVANKNKLVIYCSACNSWFHFEKKPDVMLAVTGQVCDCGETNGFIGSSLISERTWSADKPAPKITKKKR